MQVVQEKVRDNKDIAALYVTYGTKDVVSFVFKADNFSKDSMDLMKQVLQDKALKVKEGKTFSIYIDGRTVNRPTMDTLTKQTDFTKDIEKITDGKVDKVGIILRPAVKIILKGVMKVNKPKTKTRLFKDVKTGWDFVAS